MGKIMVFRPVRKLSEEDLERLKKFRERPWQLGDDGFDADGHYDETKDRRSMEDLLKDYPKELEEYREMMIKYRQEEERKKKE